jgi:hypothetical protein
VLEPYGKLQLAEFAKNNPLFFRRAPTQTNSPRGEVGGYELDSLRRIPSGYPLAGFPLPCGAFPLP